MKRFLIKISVFSAILLSYFGINSAINYYFISANKSIPMEGKKILIAGASGTQKSLNPKYFNSAQNISQPGEPYILTFWKLKRIFNTYTPDTLILEFGPANITKFNDFKFSTDEWSGELFNRSYTIENFKEVETKIPIDYSAFYRTVFKQIAFYPQKSHVKFIGRYTNTKTSHISILKSRKTRGYSLKKEELGFSTVSISYLDSIKNLCDSKQIKLVLVSSPVHNSKFKNLSKSIKDKCSEVKKKYEKNHLVIDKSYAIYPDSLFLDFFHLNEYGATRFTNEVIHELYKARTQSTVSSEK